MIRHKVKNVPKRGLPIFSVFIFWRLLLFAFLLLGFGILPLQLHFLGGGITEYLRVPQLWAWGNFDGEHYMLIAKHGYQEATYFYFPLYPILVRYFSVFFSNNMAFLYSGLFVSHVAFIVGLWGFSKLVKHEFNTETSNMAVILILLFPTSFYFASVYTESLFFALAVWTFYFARTGRYLAAGVMVGLATATRITGLALIPALFVELFLLKGKKLDLKHPGFTVQKAVSVLLSFAGIVFYMFYLHKATGDAIAFFHNLAKVFGEQRSNYLVLLPQVFYRYVFKILPNINYDYWPVVFTTYLEIGVAAMLLVLVFIGFWKLRLSYALYFLMAYLLPSFSGSFSSLPRYALLSFPGFMLLAVFLAKSNQLVKSFVFSASALLLAFSLMLFSRGYWLS